MQSALMLVGGESNDGHMNEPIVVADQYWVGRSVWKPIEFHCARLWNAGLCLTMRYRFAFARYETQRVAVVSRLMHVRRAVILPSASSSMMTVYGASFRLCHAN